MTNQQFRTVLVNIAATLSEQRTSADNRVIVAGIQVHNALTLLELQYGSDDVPHRKYQEGRDMDSDLDDLCHNKVSLIVRLTDTQLDEIEAERWGE